MHRLIYPNVSNNTVPITDSLMVPSMLNLLPPPMLAGLVRRTDVERARQGEEWLSPSSKEQTSKGFFHVREQLIYTCRGIISAHGNIGIDKFGLQAT